MILCLLLTILNLAPLHEMGYTGRGMTVALIDAGFYRADSLFGDHIVAAYDLLPADTVARYGGMFDCPDDEHGTLCLSTILGDDTHVGTAPDADVILIRTEENFVERPEEMARMAQGLYLADSLGVDVVSSSLAYGTYFADSLFDLTYADMDGTSDVALAATDVAQRRVVCVSAGNEGNTAWHYILTPADAVDVITVGAVDSLGSVAAFSSYGPSADGRLKPEVAAWGASTWVKNSRGWSRRSGTSFAAPEVAGLMTCLRQALPDTPLPQLRQALFRSADRYSSPDYRVGYGVPDAMAAYDIATSLAEPSAASLRDGLFLRDGRLYLRRARRLFTLTGSLVGVADF